MINSPALRPTIRVLDIDQRCGATVPEREKIAAVALLTASEITRFGLRFDRAWPVTETPCFDGLLRAIDEADRRLRHDVAEQEAPAQLPNQLI